MKLGQEDLVSNYYKLEGYKALSSKQKGVTVTSSNSDIIEIDSSNKILITPFFVVFTLLSTTSNTSMPLNL